MPSRISTLLGIPTLLSAQRDIHLLYLSRFLRTAAFGSTGLILAVYLSQLGHSDVRIGLFMTLTLAGDVFLSLMLTNWADRLGRRRTMILGAFLMIVSGIVFATVSNYWILLVAAVFGVISPSGNEIGPFRAVEEGTLASLTDEDSRSDIFAWHIVAGTLGVASGTFSAGWVISGLQKLGGLSELQSYRGIFGLYAILGLVKLLVATRLSTACELDFRKSDRHQDDSEEAEGMLGPGGAPSPGGRARMARIGNKVVRSFVPDLSGSTRSILWRLCLLFAVDSFASGLVAFTLLSYYLHLRFQAPVTLLSSLLTIPFIMSAISSLLASPVSKKLGLLPTMALTHLPSAIFLALLPLAPTLPLACLLLILRASLSTMDQGPRGVFLAQVVRPEERTKVMGVVNTVKTVAQSGGPTVTGAMAQAGWFGTVFVFAGALKVSYDLGLMGIWWSRRKEEQVKREEEIGLADFDDIIASDSEDENDGEDQGKDERRSHGGFGS